MFSFYDRTFSFTIYLIVLEFSCSVFSFMNTGFTWKLENYKNQLIAGVLIYCQHADFLFKNAEFGYYFNCCNNLLYKCNLIKTILLLLPQSIQWHCFLISLDVWPGFMLMLHEGLILDWAFSGSCFLPLVLLCAGTDHFMELSGKNFSLT